MMKSSDPIRLYYEECMKYNELNAVAKVDVFEVWNKWSKENQIRPITSDRFWKRLKKIHNYTDVNISNTWNHDNPKFVNGKTAIISGLKWTDYALEAFKPTIIEANKQDTLDEPKTNEPANPELEQSKEQKEDEDNDPF